MPGTPDPQKNGLAGFCSAPWTDCITYADGALKACDRNVASFGNWQEKGLKNTWESEAFQNFRRAIREGRYPDKDCASCHNNGTQRTALSSLVGAFWIHYHVIKEALGRVGHDEIPELFRLHDLLYTKTRSAESDRCLPEYFACLERLEQERTNDEKLRKSLLKLRVIGEALEDYLHGVLKPRRVATFRQSQLQAKCTARCVMCAGKYTGEIVSGPTMDTKYVDEAFAEREDITDFWCNGAEYLFYRDWKKVALMLAEEGVSMRVSTNGILLNEATIDFLVDNRILGFLTMSLDAATKETMESTRVRVNYEKNIARIRYLLRRASETKQEFEFTAAFVMMKRNLHELPAFVRLIKSLMPDHCVPRVVVLCQPLENFNIEGYRQFVHREHHCLLGEPALRELFREVHRAQKETGLMVSFYNQKLDQFVEEGMPFPKYFPRQMDVDIFTADLKAGVPLWEEGELDVARMLRNAGHDRTRFAWGLLRFARDYCRGNPVIAETAREFPAFSAELDRLLPGYVEKLVKKLEAETESFDCGSGVVKVRKHAFGPLLAGDPVYSSVSRSAGVFERAISGLALLRDGSVVPEASLRRLDSLPGSPSGVRSLTVFAGTLYLRLYALKERLLGGVKSPLLWKLSVAYRAALFALGLKVMPGAGQKEGR